MSEYRWIASDLISSKQKIILCELLDKSRVASPYPENTHPNNKQPGSRMMTLMSDLFHEWRMLNQ